MKEHEQIKNAMRFYLLATKLKYKIRSGWDEKHWNVNHERLESIAEHIYGTCILAISLDSEFQTGIDLNKVIKMLVIHEIGEVLIGDITPFDNITPEQKKEIEQQAVYDVLGDLLKRNELASLIIEFDERLTPEAKFAHCCDKLEADIQSKVYQDMGCHNPLESLNNSLVFKNEKIQQLITSGQAKTPFDVWYEWDKKIYEDSPIFKMTLNYIKDNDTTK